MFHDNIYQDLRGKVQYRELASMTTTAPNADADRRQVDLSRVEQWVLHDVLLTRCETARENERTPPWWAVDVLQKVEEGTTSLTPFEAHRIRNDIQEYLDEDDTPEMDASSAKAIVREIDATFETPPDMET